MSDRQHDQVPAAQPRWSWGYHANHANHGSPTSHSAPAAPAAQPRWSWG